MCSGGREQTLLLDIKPAQNCSRFPMGGPELFCFKRSAIGSQKGLGSCHRLYEHGQDFAALDLWGGGRARGKAKEMGFSAGPVDGGFQL